MIKGAANEVSKDNFDNFHLELKKQLVDKPFEDISRKTREWSVKASQFSVNTTNPIRAIVEHLNVQPNPDKAFIPLSVGKLDFKVFRFVVVECVNIFFYFYWQKKNNLNVLNFNLINFILIIKRIKK